MDVTKTLAKRWGKAIRHQRTHVLKWSRQQLADELGVTAQAVWMWENGDRIPADHLKPHVVQICGLDARELLAPVKKKGRAA